MKVWDLHCDTLSELRRAEKAGAPKSFLHNDLHIDLEKLQQGDYLLQCFAAYVNLVDPAPGADPLVSVLEEIDIFKRLMAAYPEKIAPVYTAADLERNRAEGKLSAMLTVEEGGCCKGSLGVLRRLQELGVRMMTLTWNYPNELAAPNANPGGPLVANTETGLTERGFAFLEEMEKLHITADVSHLSDKGFWDIVNHSTRPFAASHSNCRALSPHNRNLTDEMIRALAEKGGIAGLNYCASFVDADSAHPKLCRSTVERLAKHAAHFKQAALRSSALAAILTALAVSASWKRRQICRCWPRHCAARALPRTRWRPSTGATHTASLKTICNIKSKNCKKCPEMPCCVRVSRAVYCPARGGFIWSEARVP